MVTDQIGDFIIQIKNAGAVGKAEVSIPFSSFKMAVAEKLKQAGYIANVEKRGKKVKKTLAITLKYAEGKHVVSDVKRVSKPGRRMYVSVSEVHPVRYGKGSLILSTPKGVLTDKEAREQKVGGESLFQIW